MLIKDGCGQTSFVNFVGRPELKGFDLEGINIDQLLHVTQTQT